MVKVCNLWFECKKNIGVSPQAFPGTKMKFSLSCEWEVDMGKLRATKHGRRFKPYLVVCCGNSRLQIYVPNKSSETKPQMVPIRI